jgi:hypothetical protein
MKRLIPYLSIVLTAVLAVPTLLAEEAATSPEVLAQLPSPPPPAADTLPVSRSGASAPVPGTPAHPTLPSGETERPSVSITHTGASPEKGSHSNKTKWIIAALAAGGAAGAMMALKGGKGTAAAAAPPSLSIGAPSISIGAPPH